MAHQIGQTGRVTLESKTFEVELETHHKNKTYEEYKVDCPEGWQIPTYWLLQEIRNSPKSREKFGLLNTYEYTQNRDNISGRQGCVSGFIADSGVVYLNCNWDPSYRDGRLGVRYAREIPKE